ncbi:MAG TPA: hypothetical protein VHA30_04005 [Patescibacteria group bacterium]|nr:hypothetical protein [Patescibacteria group bacterium]
MKKIIILASALLLAAGCNRAQAPTTPPDQSWTASSTPGQTAGWNSYASPDKYGFSFQYPADFGFDTDIEHVRGLAYIPVCDENMAACAYLARDKYPNTNFDGAGVSVNIDPSLNTESKCYNFQVSTSAAQNQVADMDINGVAFKSATGGDAGAGHSEKVQVYRNFHNGLCYEIAQHVGSTNIDNYPQGTVQPFDQEQVWQNLMDVVMTFKFTNANSSASPSTPAPAPSGSAAGSPMQVTVTGTVVCLPHKNTQPGQPQTMECAFGLQEDGTGKYYALKDLKSPLTDTSAKIRVTGRLEDDSSSIYDTVGAISVVSLTELSK